MPLFALVPGAARSLKGPSCSAGGAFSEGKEVPILNPFGYVVYLGVVFLPGVAAGELLHLWEPGQSLAERLAVSLGLGLCLDTCLLVFRTSGLTVGGTKLIGLGDLTPYGIFLGALLLLLLTTLARRRFQFPTRPSRVDWLMLALVLFLAGAAALYMQKFPIFPEIASSDFGYHLAQMEAFVSGGATSIPGGVLYDGVHLQLASVFVMVGGLPLVTARVTMAILVVLSPLLFYLAALRIFSSATVAAASAAVYTFVGTIWYAGVFNSGLWPNFFGVLVSLFLVALFVDLTTRGREWPVWLVFMVATFAAYFSHYTFLTMFPALLLLPLLQFLLKRKEFRGVQTLPALAVVVPALIGVAFRPGFVSTALSLAAGSGGTLLAGTPLSSALSFFPALSYMALLANYDIGFALMLVMLGVYLWKCVPTRSPRTLFPFLWLVSILAVSPLSSFSWRYSYEALVPLFLIAAFGFGLARGGARPSVKRRKRAGRSQVRVIVAIVVFLLIAGDGWGVQFIQDAATQTAIRNLAQVDVYDAIMWIKSSGISGSSMLSVSDSTFAYGSLVGGPSILYVPFPDPAQILNSSYTYVITTNVTSMVTHSPRSPYQTYSRAFPNSTLVYSNPDVQILKIS